MLSGCTSNSAPALLLHDQGSLPGLLSAFVSGRKPGGTDPQIVREFQQRFARIVPIRDLRIFGSRARGDAAPESDLDLFIELEEASPELRQRISETAWEVGFEMDRVISRLVTTRNDPEHGAISLF